MRLMNAPDTCRNDATAQREHRKDRERKTPAGESSRFRLSLRLPTPLRRRDGRSSSLRPTAAALLAALLLAACEREAPPPLPLRPTLTVLVGTGDGRTAQVYAGEVRSKIEQPLAFRVGGKIVERLVDAGAVVQPGQVLARLDPLDTGLAAQAAEAQRRLAEADLRRYRELREKNFVSQAAVDARQTAFDAAAAQAGLARNQSAYTELRAGQTGVVGQVLAEAGQVVTAGQPVFRLARLDTPEVAIAIPEGRLTEVRKAGGAEISLWAGPERRYRGRLREVAAVADAASRTYAARVAILDADEHVGFGMSASVRFVDAGTTGRIVIPATALFQKEAQPAVWLVGADATVSLRPVEVARYDAGSVEIASGLAAGERIVAAGVHKLAPGEKIRIAEAAADSSDRSDSAR